MKIGFVSTFPPMRCAIGLYTEKLANALLTTHEDCAVTVFSELDVTSSEPNTGLDVRPVYDRDGDYVEVIERAVVDAGCSLVHFQHAGDLLGEDDRLPRLLQRLADRQIRTVVTLHTVYAEHTTGLGKRGSKHADFYRAVAQVADRIVVHQDEGCLTHLVAQRIEASKVTVIPHGTTRLVPSERAEARRALELPGEAFVLTFFGAIHLQKNVHRIVEAFTRIAAKEPNALLLVAGMPWGDRWYNQLYVNLMKARVAAIGLSSRILIRDRFVPVERVSDIYGASDIILLPHDQTYGSASGVFHQAIGAAVPVLCSIGPKFVEVRQALANVPELFVPPKSTRAWAEAMTRVIRDRSLLERGRAAAEAYARATEWPRVASLHGDLYRALLA